MLSLKEYDEIAKRCLISRGIKPTDELICETVYAIALADHRHKGDNLSGFRKSYIDFMFKHLSTKRKKDKIKLEIMDNIGYYDNNSFEFWDFIKSKLPELKYNILYDKYKNGLSYKDLSEKYNKNQRAIYWLIKKSLERLRLCNF